MPTHDDSQWLPTPVSYSTPTRTRWAGRTHRFGSVFCAERLRQLTNDDVRFNAAQTRVCHDLTRELIPQFAGVFSGQTISRYVRAAVDDLRGSASAEALPELAARLTRHRLAQH